jgi:hypothetical protein
MAGRGYHRFRPVSELNASGMDSANAALPATNRRGNCGYCGYFPAIVCVVCDSPIDALVALCVRRDEAMMMVAATGGKHLGMECFVATLHGGRPIAVLRTPEGRWAACNAFLDELFATPEEAGRKLAQLLRRGRHGYVGFAHYRPEESSGQKTTLAI